VYLGVNAHAVFLTTKEPNTMKRLTISTLALALAAAGCGGGTSVASPTISSVATFTADLRTSNEVPPIANAEAGGSGSVTITFDITRDADKNITAATAKFVVNLSGFPANTSIILSHIHQAAAGVNGSVVVNTGLSAGTPVLLANGSGSFERSGIVVSPVDIATQILANPGSFYFNSHTPLNPGGVVRGQLRVQ